MNEFETDFFDCPMGLKQGFSISATLFSIFIMLVWLKIGCRKQRLEVNLAKTNILHVRNPRQPQSKFVFLFNWRTVNYCKSSRYLGTTLNKFQNFNKTTEVQAELAGRGLGLFITKNIKNGGLPFFIYAMLFDCTLCSLSDYDVIWGFESRYAI